MEAQWRLCTRYKKLLAKGKNKPQIVTAIGRELLGFISLREALTGPGIAAEHLP